MKTFPSEALKALSAHIDAAFQDRTRTNIKPLNNPSEIRSILSGYTFGAPINEVQLLKELSGHLEQYNINITHPGYFGLFNPAVSAASVLGDVLAAVYNPQLAAWSHAPFCNELEQYVLGFLADKLDYQHPERFCNFTSGGSEANHTALLVAMAHHYPAYLKEGVFALKKRPMVYVSRFAHNSFDKALKNVGLGEVSLRRVDVNTNHEMDISHLKRLIREDKAAGHVPFMVVGTVGTTSFGSIDPLPELWTLAQEEQLWFHVDGAWGGLAGLSDALKPWLAGMEEADSITIDAHKWMNVPMGAGMFFTRHKQAVLEAFRIPADYMPKPTVGAYDPYNTTLQWSRRAIGLKVFTALAVYGFDGIVSFMEEQFELGNQLKKRLKQAGFDLLIDTPFPLVCFRHPKMHSDATLLNKVLDEIYAEGAFWISSVATATGERAFRACITSLHSETEHIEALASHLRERFALA